MEDTQKVCWTSRQVAVFPPPRRFDIVEEELDDEAILVDTRRGHTHRLNRTAWRVWRLCDSHHSTRQIAKQLNHAYHVDFEAALDCVNQLIVMLAELELLNLQASYDSDTNR